MRATKAPIQRARPPSHRRFNPHLCPRVPHLRTRLALTTPTRGQGSQSILARTRARTRTASRPCARATAQRRPARLAVDGWRSPVRPLPRCCRSLLAVLQRPPRAHHRALPAAAAAPAPRAARRQRRQHGGHGQDRLHRQHRRAGAQAAAGAPAHRLYLHLWHGARCAGPATRLHACADRTTRVLAFSPLLPSAPLARATTTGAAHRRRRARRGRRRRAALHGAV